MFHCEIDTQLRPPELPDPGFNIIPLPFILPAAYQYSRFSFLPAQCFFSFCPAARVSSILQLLAFWGHRDTQCIQEMHFSLSVSCGWSRGIAPTGHSARRYIPCKDGFPAASARPLRQPHPFCPLSLPQNPPAPFHPPGQAALFRTGVSVNAPPLLLFRQYR